MMAVLPLKTCFNMVKKQDPSWRRRRYIVRCSNSENPIGLPTNLPAKAGAAISLLFLRNFDHKLSKPPVFETPALSGWPRPFIVGADEGRKRSRPGLKLQATSVRTSRDWWVEH